MENNQISADEIMKGREVHPIDFGELMAREEIQTPIVKNNLMFGYIRGEIVWTKISAAKL